MGKHKLFVLLLVSILAFSACASKGSNIKIDINMIEKIFGFDLTDKEYSVIENSLDKSEYGGELIIKLIINKEDMDDFKAEFKDNNFLQTVDESIDETDYEMYKIYVSNCLGFEIESSETGTIYERLSGLRRKVYFVREPRSTNSFIYYGKCNENYYTVYMGYIE